MVCLTEPLKIEFLQKKQIWTSDYENDVQVEIKSNGEVYITANGTGLSKIRFLYKVIDQMKGSYIYGDAWERAYGKLGWKKESRVMPWYCLFTDMQTTWGFGVKTQPDAFCFWSFDGEFLSVTFDVRNGTEELFLNGRTLCAAVLVSEIYHQPLEEAAHAFCEKMCDTPRCMQYPVYGGNDWYCNYGQNNYEKIMTHAKRIAECAPDTSNRPYMVVDDGWQLCYSDNYNGGPWGVNSKFGSMEKLAKDMKNIGVKPGIWMRPLQTLEHVSPDCVVKREELAQTLDPSHKETLDLVKRDVEKIVDWGYELIKHDFSTYDILGKWGGNMEEEPVASDIVFSDKTKTTAQIIKNFYRTIREAAGDDVVIIGCNTISHLSAGFFEIQRTGDDTSGREWERTKEKGVNTLAFRMMQHNAFYTVDADCVGITREIPWNINRQWLDLLAKSGTPLFVSIAEDAYSEEVKEDIKAAFEKAAKSHAPSRAVDCIENDTPRIWESDFGRDEYEWDLQ